MESHDLPEELYTDPSQIQTFATFFMEQAGALICGQFFYLGSVVSG
jgi:hypothetical protein